MPPLLCDEITWKLRASDGSYSVPFRPLGEWEFTATRSGISEGQATTTSCINIDDMHPKCDRLEVCAGGELLMDFSAGNPQTTAAGQLVVGGDGLAELLEARRWERALTLSGPAGTIWRQLWDEANLIAPTGLTSILSGAGPTVTIEVDRGDDMAGTLGTLTDLITWTEHGGALYDWIAGEEPEGRPLTEEWVVNTGCMQTQLDTSTVYNDLLLAYGPELDQFVQYPPGGVDPYAACRLQAPVLEFPEITDEATALELLERWQPLIAEPAPTLPSVELRPDRTDWGDLIPGVWHRGMDGERYSLNAVTVQGVSGCVTRVVASYDQGDGRLRRRLFT